MGVKTANAALLVQCKEYKMFIYFHFITGNVDKKMIGILATMCKVSFLFDEPICMANRDHMLSHSKDRLKRLEIEI